MRSVYTLQWGEPTSTGYRHSGGGLKFPPNTMWQVSFRFVQPFALEWQTDGQTDIAMATTCYTSVPQPKRLLLWLTVTKAANSKSKHLFTPSLVSV